MEDHSESTNKPEKARNKGWDNIIGKGFDARPEDINRRGNYKKTPHSKKRLIKILSLLQKKKNPLTGKFEDLSIIERMDIAQVIKALNGDTKAYKELLDRLEGQATQRTDFTTDGEKLNITPIEWVKKDEDK